MSLSSSKQSICSDNSTIDITIIKPPSLATLYAKALLKLLFKARKKQIFSPFGYALAPTRIQPKQLKRYQELCHFKANNALPSTYPHLLSFPLQLKIVADARFPVPLKGLVHIKNSIRHYRDISITDYLQVRCALIAMRPCEKGIEFDIETSVWVESELVWQCVSTNLSKQGKAHDKLNSPKKHATTKKHSDKGTTRRFVLAKNLARQYARLGGDFNPIHIHSTLARLMGFKGMLIHGMYNKARCLAEIENAGSAIQPPLSYDAQFKTPAYLPSTMNMRWEKKAAHLELSLENEASRKPHMSGQIKAL